MTLGSESKGYQWSLGVGAASSEQTIGVTGVTISVNNNVAPLFEAGSRTAVNILEGNQEFTGTITRAVKDDFMLGQVLGTTSSIDFVGINNGSATHIASQKTAATTTQAPGSWSGTELSNGEYDEIEADDASDYNLTSAAGGSAEYAAMLFKFDNVGTEANIPFVKFTFIGYGTADTNGFEVLAYDFDGTEWVSLGTSNAAAAQGSLTVTLSNPEEFIEVTTADIYFQVRTRVVDDGDTAAVLNCDYVKLEVNDTSGTPIQSPVSLRARGLNSSGSLTITLSSVKFDTWGFEFDDTGTTVFETVNYLGTTITVAQT
jgi:hypothetical protein